MTRRTRLWALLLLIAAAGCQPNDGPVDEGSQDSRPPASSLSQLSQLGSESEPEQANDVVPRFADVARQLGIDFEFYADIVPERYFLPEIMGGGVAWIDYDLDGQLDLYAANGAELVPGSSSSLTHLDAFYRQVAGRFVSVADLAGIHEPSYGQGVAIGDYDADGFPDIFVANYGVNRLFHNQGDGSFRECSMSVGITGDDWSSSPVWLDVDADGDLDLFVVNYMNVRPDNYRACPYGGIIGYCGPGEYQGIDDQVWLNDSAGGFREAGRELGLVGSNGKGLAIVAVDLDDDLKPEIYVANDMVNNFLFTRGDSFQGSESSGNESPETGSSDSSVETRTLYSEVGQLSGTAASETGQPEASMGIATGDMDGDGRIDLHLTHYHTHKNTLYRNRGRLMFTDESKRSGIARLSLAYLGFGTTTLDFDRDSDLDLFVANGHVLGPHHDPNEMSPQLLANDGKGLFSDISGQAGDYFAGQYLARSVASGDWDNDGDLDLAINRIGDPLTLLDNQTETERSWIGLSLFDPMRRDLVGTRVEVVTGETRQVIPVRAGGSYLASPDPRLLIGLGSFDIDSVSGEDEATGNGAHPSVTLIVHWMDGMTEEWAVTSVDRYWLLEPGKAPVDLSNLPN